MNLAIIILLKFQVFKFQALFWMNHNLWRPWPLRAALRRSLLRKSVVPVLPVLLSWMFYVSTQPNSALPVSDLGLEQLRISVRSSHSSFPSVVLSWHKRQISSFLCQAVIQTDHTEFAPRSWSEFHLNGIIFVASSGSASVVESVSFRGRP